MSFCDYHSHACLFHREGDTPNWAAARAAVARLTLKTAAKRLLRADARLTYWIPADVDPDDYEALDLSGGELALKAFPMVLTWMGNRIGRMEKAYSTTDDSSIDQMLQIGKSGPMGLMCCLGNDEDANGDIALSAFMDLGLAKAAGFTRLRIVPGCQE